MAAVECPQSPELQYFTSPESVRDFFDTRLPSVIPDGWVLKRCVPKVIKRRLGSRCVIAYRLVFGDARGAREKSFDLVGKRYADGAEAGRSFETMLLLWGGGFGEGESFRIPKPIAYFADLRLILQQRGRGVALSSYLGKNSDRSLAHVRRAAGWLAKLHRLEVTPARLCSYEEDMRALNVFVEELGRRHTSLALQLQPVASAVEQRLKTLQPLPAAMVHGDYHPENILVRHGEVCVVDLDRFCISDPAKDVGHFIAQMRSMAYFSQGSLEASSQDGGAFLDAYLAAAAFPGGAEFTSRVALFAAHALLESLYYILCVVRREDSGVIPTWLAEVERFASIGNGTDIDGRGWEATRK